MPDGFMTVQAMAVREGLDAGHLRRLAGAGLVPGASKFGHVWTIPVGWRYVKRRAGWPKGRKRLKLCIDTV